MLSVIMLSVDMLSVEAPTEATGRISGQFASHYPVQLQKKVFCFIFCYFSVFCIFFTAKAKIEF
jgi:hypothetical protein